jgi:hypothetical protein
MMIDTARTSETLTDFYQTTRRNNPEDGHLRTHRREKLKSHKFVCFVFVSFMLHAYPFPFNETTVRIRTRLTVQVMQHIFYI